MPSNHKNSKKIPYKPWIEVSVAAGDDPKGFGLIVATLHYNARDIVLLSEYEVQGPACSHVAYEANPEDLKALDQLIARAKAIGDALAVPVRHDKEATADLVWEPANTEP